MGKDFYRVPPPQTHPIPDHAFYDDENGIGITFEYKPQTEKKRGILTGLGQSIAYLNKSDISFLVIPKKLAENNFDIRHEMTEVFEKQIVGKLPVGLIVFDNDVPSEVSMIHNVDSLLGRKKIVGKPSGRFWAKYIDLPIPLFHLILHYYYLGTTNQKKGDPLARCWSEKMFHRKKAIRLLRPHAIKDINEEVIMTAAGQKELKYFEKRLEEARRLPSKQRPAARKKLEQDARTDMKERNYYNSAVRGNIKPFLQHIGVVADNELTELGIKLYHLGLANGPKSSIFRDYFLKCVLEQGHHLDLIFDLDDLTKDHRGEMTTVQIRSLMEKEYEADGMVKRKPGRVAGKASNTTFLKNEMILWKSLGVTQKTEGKPDLAFDWEKITGVRGLPEL